MPGRSSSPRWATTRSATRTRSTRCAAGRDWPSTPSPGTSRAEAAPTSTSTCPPTRRRRAWKPRSPPGGASSTTRTRRPGGRWPRPTTTASTSLPGRTPADTPLHPGSPRSVSSVRPPAATGGHTSAAVSPAGCVSLICSREWVGRPFEEAAAVKFDTYPQKPHGGQLVDQVVPESQRAAEIERARSLPTIRIDLEAAITIEMIATGVLSPLRGFMTQADYISVLEDSRLADGTVWPVPLSFAPSGARNAEIVRSLSIGDEVALADADGEPVAILTLDDIFDYDKEHRARKIFGTDDRSHPGVDSIHRRMGDVALGGPLRL